MDVFHSTESRNASHAFNFGRVSNNEILIQSEC